MDNRPPITSQERVTSSTQIFSFSPGLYTVVVTRNRFLNVKDKNPLPGLHVASTPFSPGGKVEFLGSTGTSWLSRVGDALAIGVTGGEAMLSFTSLKPSDQPDATIDINLQRIDSAAPAQSRPSPATGAMVPRPQIGKQPDSSQNEPTGQKILCCEVLVHVQRYGDMRILDVNWAGLPGRGKWIEAISITPLEDISRDELEYKGLTRDGVETPWIKAGGLCGSRGLEMALTGIAIRLTGEAARRYDVAYEVTFVGGARGAKGQNGSPLRSDRIGDAIEALRVIVVEKRRDLSPERIF